MNLLLILSTWLDSLESSITDPFGNLYSSLKSETRLQKIKVSKSDDMLEHDDGAASFR
jgi:hypothetical protein